MVEVVSPGSRRTDNVVKRAEYADAGIPHYWIVGLDRPTSLLECRLTKRFGYREAQSASGAFATAEPFPVHLDLEQLR